MRGYGKKIVIAMLLIMLLFAACAGKTEKAKTGKEKATTPAISGKAIYDANCRVCHGVDGKGVPGTGAADLTVRAKELTLEQIKNQIKNGGKDMPAFAKALTDEEIDAVARYEKETFG